MKKVLLVAVVALLAIACNKNQSAVKKLDGVWNVTKFATTDSSGVSVDLSSLIQMEYTFDGCKLKDNEYCNVSVKTTFFGQSDTQTSLYTVKNDGETLEFKQSDSLATVTTLDIVSLSRSTLVLKQIDGSITNDIELAKK